MELIVRGGTIVTIDPAWRLELGDLLVRDGRIVQVGGDAIPRQRDYDILDAEGALVVPGFVQTHLHSCQTLARGRVDDLPLEAWLAQVIWPYEDALEADDVAAAARLAYAELLLSGTTAVQDMGTVRHTDAVFTAAAEAGLRATIGKALMDSGPAPAALREPAERALAEAVELAGRWHGEAGGRLRYAMAPRFPAGSSDRLLRDAAAEARRLGVRLHTHAAETREEAGDVRRLHELGVTGPDVGLAHCVWVEPEDIERLAGSGTHVLHCPSANLKLGSGVAPVDDMLRAGVAVSVGTDGAGCNDSLDALHELRLAALLQKSRAGAAALPAPLVVRLATLGGAAALGLEDELGSLEEGKRADLAVVELRTVGVAPAHSPYRALVYACGPADVRHVVVNGRIVVRDRRLLTLDVERVVEDARRRARRIFAALRRG